MDSSSIWTDPPDREGITPAELEEYEAGWRKDERTRAVVLFAWGALAGAGGVIAFIGFWLLSA